jgi:hypothetical protein
MQGHLDVAEADFAVWAARQRPDEEREPSAPSISRSRATVNVSGKHAYPSSVSARRLSVQYEWSVTIDAEYPKLSTWCAGEMPLARDDGDFGFLRERPVPPACFGVQKEQPT